VTEKRQDDWTTTTVDNLALCKQRDAVGLTNVEVTCRAEPGRH